MIQLFDIPMHVLDMGNYDHILHGRVVRDFEEEFADYVGAKHAVSLSSASAAIFLLLRGKLTETIRLPSMVPIAVVNAVVNAGKKLTFYDDTDWVGGSYTLLDNGVWKIIDSAQRIDRDQFRNECDPDDLVFFSFYPTKPLSSSDGGMVVSDDKAIINSIRAISNDGTVSTGSKNSWERIVLHPGWKMYMNSLQADIARRNLRELDRNKTLLSHIRNQYNQAFGLENTSDHLYRIEVEDNQAFLKFMAENQIVAGIHYTAAHTHPAYATHLHSAEGGCPKTRRMEKRTASIPLHPRLTDAQVSYIIEKVEEYHDIQGSS